MLVSAHGPVAPAPDDEIEYRDVDDAEEDALRAEHGLLERNAHEPRVGKHHGKLQDRRAPQTLPRHDPVRGGDEDGVQGDDNRRGERQLPQEGDFERTLEDVHDQAGRDDEDKDVDHALDGRLVHDFELAAQGADRHQREENADLGSHDEKMMQHVNPLDG